MFPIRFCFFLFLFSQSVSPSCFCSVSVSVFPISQCFGWKIYGETVSTARQRLCFCTEFEHRWTNASCLGFCFYVPNLFLSVSVFPICFCFHSMLRMRKQFDRKTEIMFLHRIRTQMNQCFLFRFLFLCSQSVSVFSICFCFLSLFQFLFSQSINGFGWGNSSTARIATEIMLLCLCFCFPSLFLFMFLFVMDSKMLFFCSLIFNVWLDFFLPRRVNCLL